MADPADADPHFLIGYLASQIKFGRASVEGWDEAVARAVAHREEREAEQSVRARQAARAAM